MMINNFFRGRNGDSSSRRRSTQPDWKVRQTVLNHRLKELLVFEIHREGMREYKNMTLRELYNYVLEAIATKPIHLQLPSPRPSIDIGDNNVENTSNSVRESTSSVHVRRGTVSDAQTLSSSYGHLGMHGEDHNRVETSSGPTAESRRESEEQHQAEDRIPNALTRVHTDTTLPMPAFPSKQSTGIDKTTTPFKTVERNFAGPPKWYPQHVTYRERLGGYLHPRDMRRLVTPFSSSNEPELIVRRHVMLLNFDPLRAIVLRDRLLVLVPDGADSILETLTQRVEGGLSEESVFGTEHVIEPSEPSSQAMREDESLTSRKEPSAPGKRASDPSQKEGKKSAERKPTEKKRHHSFPSFEKKSGIHDYHEGRRYENYEDEEWDDLKGKQWIDLPFELQSVDAVLHTVSIMLTEESNELQGYAYAAIEELLAASNLSGAHGHEILRSCKGELNQMTRRVQGFIRAINQVLDEDEDLALMNLSRLITHPERFIQPVSEEILHEESDEPELILEAYLQESLTNQNSLDLLKGEITTIEELVNMKLDTIRNRLLFVNTVVSLLTLIVGAGSYIGAIFGMNLYSGLEESETAWRQVVLGSSLGGIGLVILLWAIFYKAGTLPSLT